MRRTKAFTLVELLVVVGIIGLLVAILVPTLQQANELTSRTVCMSNLSSIGKGLVLYKGANDNKWPYILKATATTWLTTDTGTNKTTAPPASGGAAVARSITSLMFMLVRDGQPAKLFNCPSYKNAEVDANTRYLTSASDPNSEAYCWDFTSSRNVSYSWQCPLSMASDANGANGIDDNFPETAIIGDQTPMYTGVDGAAWSPVNVGTLSRPEDVMKQMSQNHSKGKKANFLHVGMNVAQYDRPDKGYRNDNMYTAAGTSADLRAATQTTFTQHTQSKDTFLFGPWPKQF